MGNITPNKRGKVTQAKKRLKGFLVQLRDDWDSATTAQKLTLTKKILIAVLRIQLHMLGRDEDVD